MASLFTQGTGRCSYVHLATCTLHSLGRVYDNNWGITAVCSLMISLCLNPFNISNLWSASSFGPFCLLFFMPYVFQRSNVDMFNFRSLLVHQNSFINTTLHNACWTFHLAAPAFFPLYMSIMFLKATFLILTALALIPITYRQNQVNVIALSSIKDHKIGIALELLCSNNVLRNVWVLGEPHLLSIQLVFSEVLHRKPGDRQGEWILVLWESCRNIYPTVLYCRLSFSEEGKAKKQ